MRAKRRGVKRKVDLRATERETNPLRHLPKKIKEVTERENIDYDLGGRLQNYAEKWKILNSDWAYNTVAHGARFSFTTKPRLRRIKRLDKRTSPTVDDEVRTLIKKGVVKRVPSFSRTFVSPLFTVPKPNGSHRLIINMKKLNKFIRKEKFKMLKLKDAFDAIPKGSWACSIDLKEAYLQVPLSRSLRKYVSFSWHGRLYVFRTLCFGLTSAPRLFTKLLRAIVIFARTRGINVLAYLDDLLVFFQSRRLSTNDRQISRPSKRIRVESQLRKKSPQPFARNILAGIRLAPSGRYCIYSK